MYPYHIGTPRISFNLFMYPRISFNLIMYPRISIHLYGYQECIELDGGAGNCHPFKVTKSIVCISAAQLVNQQMSLFREDSNGSSKGKLKKKVIHILSNPMPDFLRDLFNPSLIWRFMG